MHAQGVFTHMPFIFDDKILLFAAGLDNPQFPSKDWRIGYVDAHKNEWKLFDTGLPAGTVECSPTAYINATTNKIVVCFLASTPSRPTYFLYRMFGESWDTLSRAQCSGFATYHGFINDHLFVTSRFLPNDDIHVSIKKRTGIADTLVAVNQYIHKVSYVSNQPKKLIISLQKKENPRHAKELVIDTDDYSCVYVAKKQRHKIYKLSLFDDTALYAKKLAGFDERQICATTNMQFNKEPLQLHLTRLPTTHG